MFTKIIKRKQINKNVYLIKYINGVINIKTPDKNFVYYFHTVTSSINEFRKQNKYLRY